MFDGIIRGAQDLLQNFFWSILQPLIELIKSLVDALINGVLGLDIFTDNEYISGAYACAVAIMFLIIPAKIAYELVTAMVKDDDAGLDVHKKMGSAILGIMIAVSLTVGVTTIINPAVKDISQKILSVNMVTKDASGNEVKNYDVGDSLIKTVLVSFGGMAEGGPYGASKFMEAYNGQTLNITERYDMDGETDIVDQDAEGEKSAQEEAENPPEDTDMPADAPDQAKEEVKETTKAHKKYDYVWQFGMFMSIVGCAIYVVLLFMLIIQIAVRMIAIGFYYIIGPICCTSLTNYQNPQMFNVWRNTLLGQWAMNVTQIFLLSLFVGLIDSITKASASYPIATAALYFGAFSLILSAPNFVQAMIGGYSAGVMESLNQIRGGFGMAAGAVGGAVAATIGRKNKATGHREGGIRGAVMGNKQVDGSKKGGVAGANMGNKVSMNGIEGRQGGLRGLAFGNDTFKQGKNGETIKERKGGVAHAGRKLTTNFDKAGNKTSQTQNKALSAFRGSTTKSFDAAGNVTSQTQNRGVVPRGLTSLNNRIRGGTSKSGTNPLQQPKKHPKEGK
ncbi:MAG: hypothetical protein SO150_03555 [Faecalicoccus sp.]|uniref:conjugal transfer protein TrbL family protein n=1 Tax=Faecalicoccus sp. TaxID=1971758 RepID=UPI002A82448F|nr:conjugal transfer protein TrbL family protein [Faecalicoccus sp.]MDY4869403.1 hypothetical protein [Faecalicoccus sp.]MDY5232721.1 hypothetical protein [Faecalicoccus sp.]